MEPETEVRAIQQPCPGCPTLSWMENKQPPPVCSDCGCTVQRFHETGRAADALYRCARVLPERLRALPLLFACMADAHPLVRPPLTVHELEAVRRFKLALLNLWHLDQD